MSSAEAVPNTEAKRRQRNRRGGSGRNRRRGGGRGGNGESGGENAPARVRTEYPPAPDAMIGTKQTGIVNTVVRKGRVRFGFILIGETSDPDAVVPRVYFSFSNVADESVIIRRGYVVSFEIKKDDQDRPYADTVALTEEGKKIAADREAKIAERRAEDAAAGIERPRRERKPREEKLVTMKVLCEGKSEQKMIEFNVNQSVGKMKNLAAEEFDAPKEYSVYHITAANPAGVFMTKAILNELTAADTIKLAPKREGDA